MMPETNCCPTEVPIATQRTIMGALGGISTPMEPPAVMEPMAMLSG